MLSRKYIDIDFEYRNSQERDLELVCCSYVADGKLHEKWLHQDDKAYAELASELTTLGKAGYIFRAYYAPAEARSVITLGMDPHEYEWHDIYTEWVQLQNKNDAFQYGRYFKDGVEKCSEAPHLEPRRNIGKDNLKVGKGLVAVVGHLLGIDLDKDHKDRMRDLILHGDEFTAQDRADIMKYCSSDIAHLEKCSDIIDSEILAILKCSAEYLRDVQENRASFQVSLAKMENEGFPVIVEKIQALRDNFPRIREHFIEELNEVYPFFERKRRTKGQLRGDWVSKYGNFYDLVESKGLLAEWPVTNSGKLDRSADVLQKYAKTIPEVRKLLSITTRITQLKWFVIGNDGTDIFDNIGTDGRLRMLLGGYGTQTSRSAPRAKTFIPAMSGWLRSLIMAAPGRAIVAIDWGSQEFHLSAHMSKDKNMIEAYAGGDPYIYLAKSAGSIPQDANDKHVKEPWAAPEQQQDYYKTLSLQRKLAKNTTLGLSYGLGVAGLRQKLENDMGRPVRLQEAQKLVDIFKRTYRDYYRWGDNNLKLYKKYGFLKVSDGWFVGPNNPNSLSMKNFPVQATGAVCMRLAVRRAHREGLTLLFPLHDAIYAECDIKDIDKTAETLGSIMVAATRDIAGNKEGHEDVRIDTDIHKHGEVWIEPGKAQSDYEKLNHFTEPMDDEVSSIDLLLNMAPNVDEHFK